MMLYMCSVGGFCVVEVFIYIGRLMELHGILQVKPIGLMPVRMNCSVSVLYQTTYGLARQAVRKIILILMD